MTERIDRTVADVTKDNLVIGGWSIFQHRSPFRFGTDAVLLYDLLPARCGKYIDLCSGNGAVALMALAGGKAEHAQALELNPDSCALAAKSAAENGASDRLEIRCGDLRQIGSFYPPAAYDTVSVNPPYFVPGRGLLPPDRMRAAARHEVCCTLENVLAAAKHLLRKGGRLCMVHTYSRRDEILQKIQKYDFSLRREVAVFTRPGRQAQLLLLLAEKEGAVCDVKQECFTVQTVDGQLSEQYKKIYEE